MVGKTWLGYSSHCFFFYLDPLTNGGALFLDTPHWPPTNLKHPIRGKAGVTLWAKAFPCAKKNQTDCVPLLCRMVP